MLNEIQESHTESQESHIASIIGDDSCLTSISAE